MKIRNDNFTDEKAKITENANTAKHFQASLANEQLNDIHDVSSVQASLDAQARADNARTFQEKVEAYRTQLNLEKGGRGTTADEQKKINKAVDTFASNESAKELNTLKQRGLDLDAKLAEAKQPILSLDSAEIEQARALEQYMDDASKQQQEINIEKMKEIEIANRIKDAQKQINELNEQSNEIGMSAPDKEVASLKNKGITDPKTLADAWQAAAKLAGKELTQSLMTPLDKFTKEIADLDQLKAAGAIDQKTYNRAASKDYEELGSNQGQSIQERFTTLLTASFLRNQGGGGDTVADKQLSEQQKTNKLLEQQLAQQKDKDHNEPQSTFATPAPG
jgi:hypothetical protein